MIDQIFRNILGNKDSLNLEGNIFISASILGVIVGVTSIIWNLFLGLSLVQNILIGIVVLFFIVIYYFARFKQIYNSKVFILISILILSCSWFLNNGIRGSVPVLYLLAIILFLSITNAKDHFKVLLVTVLNFASLIVVESKFGDMLMVSNQSEDAIVTDNIFGYIVTIFFSYLLLTNIIKTYYKERDNIEGKKQEMKKMNDSKDLLFNIIAHDLRSPFTGLLGITEIMADKSKKLSNAQYQKYANLTLRTMTKTYGLLETLLDWGRIQQGKIQVNPQKINLKQVVEESLELFEEKCTSKMIEMSININDTIEPYTDKCSLQTVIRNLVSNAVKYTHQSGKIYIEAEELGGNKVMVSIKDNGIGMDKEIVDNLFHFDIKSNRPGLDGEPSVGLGLIISKELIENQGGVFEVESEVDCGTTFKFTVQN